MTVSWGNMGIMWNKNIVTVFVRPQRYTREFIERSDKFTLSFYDESMRPALRLCGSKSGRDLDKAAAAGLTPVFENGTTYFAQAKLVLECRKIYCDKIRPEGFLVPEINDSYGEKDYHFVYMGEIPAGAGKVRSFRYVVPPRYNGAKLQDFLRYAHSYSRRLIIELKRGGMAVNGAHRRMVDPVFEGDVVEISFLEEPCTLVPNAALSVPIVYEDEDLVVFNKPSGMSVHPAADGAD